MPTRAPSRRPRAAGSVTAELALALPAVMILLTVVLAVASTVTAQLSCIDAARAGARAAARAESDDRVSAVARAIAPDGAAIQVSRGTRWVRVTVRASLRPGPGGGGPTGLTVSASAVADVEHVRGLPPVAGVR